MKFISRKIFYIPLILLVIAIGIYSLFRKTDSPAFVTSEIKAGLLTQEVVVSGTVKDKEAVELGFEKSGRLRKVNVSVGSKVAPGDTLLALENGVEMANLEDAKAKLASKQAHYADLKTGGRPEEIQVKESELAKTKAQIATEYATVQNIILDSFNKVDNAIHRQADILFSNPLSSNPKLSFNSSDQQSAFEAESGRVTAENVLASFKKLTEGSFDSPTANETSLTQARNHLLTINNFLIITNKALNAATNLSESALNTDKDALNTARANINTAISNIIAQIQTIATQKITIETAQNQLALIKIGATDETLLGTEADIRGAEANVKNAEALLLKNYITSPIHGVVTKQDAKVGQIASANTSLVSVASGNYKIEAFIPEVDIAKVAVGNKATITLDAYGSELPFSARVVKIDPAETVIAGVSTYKTTLSFDKADARIRSGMTANTTIETALRQNVLTVPQRAIYDKDGKKYVRILKNSFPVEREITVGLKGSTGTVEVLSGISVDDLVITSGKTK